MSSKRPIVGIPACIKPIGIHNYHVVGQKYIDALTSAAACMPLPLPALGDAQDREQLLGMIDGLLLTGSASNVEPKHYGQVAHSPEMLIDTARDETTLPLIRAAIEIGMPVFGICRGFQEINVAMGGTLHQQVHAVPGRLDHREDNTQPLEVQYGPAHPVTLLAGGALQNLFGGTAEIQVNSVHGQGIDCLGAGLVAEAIAPDGQIEAVRVEAASGFAMAVQWHPEWKVMDNPESAKLFSAFGDACRRYRDSK
ncbi:MAG: gamma-glutamyl-gamma-aminobutyrate hydrolase family protein [Rhodocyclaceae bacterium]|nr:gamma-glutamyl-gamma-aminobutyrate hydrolase family protein [Rhodocyclaceae bacterium]